MLHTLYVEYLIFHHHQTTSPTPSKKKDQDNKIKHREDEEMNVRNSHYVLCINLIIYVCD